ncbi:hypothetical protein RQP46_004040 [Phenoliferia psychrophenolica]
MYFGGPPKLDTLPPELLLKIFSPIDLPTPGISKRLAPFARLSVWRKVDVFSLASLFKLQETITQQPEIGALICELAISYFNDDAVDSDWEDDDDSDAEGEEDHSSARSSDEVDEVAGTLDALTLDVATLPKHQPTSQNPLDSRRLTAFLNALPNLERYIAFSKRLMPRPGTVLPKLRLLSTLFRGDECFDAITDSDFLINASKLPLDTLELHDVNAIPLDEAEFEDEEDAEDWPLQPRVWQLKKLVFEHLTHLGPAARYLFETLNNLEDLVINALIVPDDFSTYFTYLPSTLGILRLRIGDEHATPLTRASAPTLAPFTRASTAQFANLAASTWAARSSLARFHICHCPDGANEGLGSAGRTRWVPNWQTGFARPEAKALVRACHNSVGADGLAIMIDGTILCALKECGAGRDPMHECERDGH